LLTSVLDCGHLIGETIQSMAPLPAGDQIMAVSKFGTRLCLVLILGLLAAVRVPGFDAPSPGPFADVRDARDEDHYRKISTIGRAMADAYKRYDQEALKRLYAEFHQVLTDHTRQFRDEHPLPDSPQEKQP
jgi:hypothetical protein